MGISLSVLLTKKVKNADFDNTDGWLLYNYSRELDEICESKGLCPLFSSFIFDPESMEEPPEGELLEETYYDPKEGLKVVAGLIEAIELPKGKARKKVDEPEELIDDLKELERCLELALKAKVKFCLLTY